MFQCRRSLIKVCPCFSLVERRVRHGLLVPPSSAQRVGQPSVPPAHLGDRLSVRPLEGGGVDGKEAEGVLLPRQTGAEVQQETAHLRRAVFRADKRCKTRLLVIWFMKWLSRYCHVEQVASIGILDVQDPSMAIIPSPFLPFQPECELEGGQHSVSHAEDLICM